MKFFESMAKHVSQWSGSTAATIIAFAMVTSWTIGGFFFGFGDSYQMIINTSTTIITFLMVFLIQRAQNKESSAVQIKLNELIAAVEGASNRILNVEDLSEDEISELRQRYHDLMTKLDKDNDITIKHTIEEVKKK